MTTADPLLNLLRGIETQLRSTPVFRWAVVTSTNPLRIRLEEDTLPLLGTPATLVKGLMVGDRVRVELQNGRATVHGRGAGPGVNVLYTGGQYMTEPQTANLSQRISAQPAGIVTVWSGYSSGSPNNHTWNHNFIAKSHVENNPGTGIMLPIGTGATSNTSAFKYIYVHDDRLTGHAANSTAPRNGQVLRFVIGV